MTKVTKENFGDLLLKSAEQALEHSKKKTLKNYEVVDIYPYYGQEANDMMLAMAKDDAPFEGWDIDSLEVELVDFDYEDGKYYYDFKVIGNYA